MSEARLPLHVFPCINWFTIVSQQEIKSIQLDLFSNWRKQSPLSRFEIAGPNKRLQLIIPTKKRSRKQVGDVEIDYTENWVKDHLRSLEAAYNRSPFFEYYRDELQTIYDAQYKMLHEFNLASIKWCCLKLALDVTLEINQSILKPIIIEEGGELDYPQVFSEKLGFLPNLSILDLLFNLGSESGSVIDQQTLDKPPSY